MPNFGDRLRFAREEAGFSQTAFAEMCGVTMRSQRNYEKGERHPDALYLSKVAEADVDVLYVLTGQRNTVKTMSKRPPLDDRERLTLAAEVVTEGLADVGKNLPSRKLAELILAAYDLMADPIQSKDNVIQLIRKIA